MEPKSTRGYFTIEAALILPMVMGVYVFVIVLLFLHYDRCQLEQDMASMMIKVSSHGGSAGQQLDYLQELADGWDRERYLWLEPEMPHITIKEQKILLEESGGYRLPIYGGIGNINGEQRLELEYQLMIWDYPALARMLAGRQAKEEEDESD